MIYLVVDDDLMDEKEISPILVNFCGKVVSSFQFSCKDPCIVYFCGDVTEFMEHCHLCILSELKVVREFSYNCDETRALRHNYQIVDKESIPLTNHDSGQNKP